MIPDEIVEQVQAAADIVAIIGEHVKLRKSGSAFRGPCPFHQGTGPNFSVLPRGGYYCFVCHEKGSVFTFVQKRLGLSFVEAVKYVGEKSGIEVREVERHRTGPDPREPLWELNGTAASWFRTRLWEWDGAAAAREYLARRHVSRATAERFGLGYAPHEIGLMRAYLNGLGFSDERLLEVGLLVKRDDAEEPRPRFRDRLMFPIADASGHVAGFGGRLLGPGEPKYLNSADSAVFAKGRLLFNYAAARHAIRKAERVIIVEGYFDALRMVDAGLDEVIAPMGTALTDEQADVIARSAPTVFLLYDSDPPGQKASFRAADVLLQRGIAVRVVTLPEGDDPDTFVARNGPAAIEALLEQAMDVFDRKVQLLERGGWFADLQRKRRALDRLLPTIRATADPIMRDLYLARAAEAAGVARDVLVRELELVPGWPRAKGVGAGRRREPARRDAGGEGQAGAREAAAPPGHVEQSPDSSAERELVRVMLLHPDLAERVIEEVARVETDSSDHPDVDESVAAAPAAAMRDPVYAAVFEAIARVGAHDAEALAEALDPTANYVVELLRAEPGAIVDPARTVTDAVRMLRARALRERIDEHARMIPLAEERDKPELLRREAALRKELAAVGGREWRAARREEV